MTTAANALVDIDHEHRQQVAAPAMTDAGPMTPMQMAYHLIQNGADLGAVKEMLAMSKELAADQARREFEEAVAAAKAEIQPVTRNAKGHNDKRYADFSAYAKAVDPIITKHGLSYRFRTQQNENRITVTCILAHKSGHFEENDLSGPADTSGSKNAIQAIGSTLTYLQRYSLIQALGLAASNDDDGKAAGNRDENPIGKEQIKKLLDLITASGAEIDLCCEKWGISSVPEMPVWKFDEAYSALDAWHKRQQKGAA
jgi:hypothetical protein